MLVKKEEWLLAPKTVVKSLGVAAGTVAAAATLVFAIAGEPARADDTVLIHGGTTPEILSDAQLDKVCGAFVRSTDFAGRTIIIDNPKSMNEVQSAFSAFKIPGGAGHEVYQEYGPNSEVIWEYFPNGGTIPGSNLTVPKDTLVRLYRDPNDPNHVNYTSAYDPNSISFMVQNSGNRAVYDKSVGAVVFTTAPLPGAF